MNIIHVDMDAFFASIEQSDNKKLKGKPVIVGGMSGRGVVSTCSYEARKYGVHSAMPMFMAKKLCPNGIYLPVRMSRYKEISNAIFHILYGVTDRVEPLSIDEAYLDVTALDTDNIRLGKKIKNAVFEATGLTVSVGISYNKFLAKIASDWNKPDGLMVITKEMVPDILKPLSVDKVYGIGAKTAEKLKAKGVANVGELLNFTEKQLIQIFGKYGEEIYLRIRGIDDRPVKTTEEIKSIGRETTLPEDVVDKKILLKFIKKFVIELSGQLKKHGYLTKTVTLKLKTSDFVTHTKARSTAYYTDDADELYEIGLDLLKNMEYGKAIRLIGITFSNFELKIERQLTVFDKEYENDVRLQKIINYVNSKTGRNSLIKGTDLKKETDLKLKGR